jgi:hypothetical protein
LEAGDGHSGLVLALSEISREDLNRVGSKAATLSELLRSGFAVPILTHADISELVLISALEFASKRSDVGTLERSLDLWQQQLSGDRNSLKLSPCRRCDRSIDKSKPYVRKLIADQSDVILGPLCSTCLSKELKPVTATVLTPNEYYRLRQRGR